MAYYPFLVKGPLSRQFAYWPVCERRFEGAIAEALGMILHVVVAGFHVGMDGATCGMSVTVCVVSDDIEYVFHM